MQKRPLHIRSLRLRLFVIFSRRLGRMLVRDLPILYMVIYLQRCRIHDGAMQSTEPRHMSHNLSFEHGMR
jgi:hypothetical protein